MRKSIDEQRDLVRIAAEADLVTFIQLIAPQRVLGSLHVELIRWITRQDRKSHQLVLLPRDHMKSAISAYHAAWTITRYPAVRILYLSSTANLAIKQLKFIKDILTSDRYRRYWPEMVNVDEGKREKWTEAEIAVDHPLRKEEAVRDPTVFTAGLTTGITGLHCDWIYPDDVVVLENAYFEEGREKVRQQYSLLASIEATDANQLVVGTRYHPKDLYDNLQKMMVDHYDTDGNALDGEYLYEVFERQVENIGDGSGEFLWPQQFRYDGKPFGFNRAILEKKRAQYLDKVQFRAQYYNDPNDPEGAGINRDCFQYYDRKHLTRNAGKWYIKGRRLNIYASVDFAFSLAKRADSTSIVVVGIDADRNYYVLDVDRFKSQLISEYYQHILSLHQKWDFRWLRAEVSVGQKVIVEDLKANYIRRDGLSLVVEDYRPMRSDGTKAERVQAILQPKYANRQVWHYEGGYCQILEEELVLQNPPHDDIKDALASCVDSCIAPSAQNNQGLTNRVTLARELVHHRFGGIQ